MREKGGLLYSLIDTNGEPVGVPIKASAIYNQPTLKNLQKEFERNEERRQPFKLPLCKAIDRVFQSYSEITKATFIEEMQRQQIDVIFRSNAEGFIYGVTFIDHHNKAVFNGSNLGKGYSARAILGKFANADKKHAQEQDAAVNPKAKTIQRSAHSNTFIPNNQPNNKLQIALAKYQTQAAPSVTRKKKKRKGQEQDQQQSL